jgi:transposase
VAKVFEVRDEVWEAVAPLLPAVEPAATGRPRVPDRVAFNADRVRARDRDRVAVRDWQRAGVWERLHATLLDRLNAAGAIDWSAAVVDGSHIRALQGGLDRALAR